MTNSSKKTPTARELIAAKQQAVGKAPAPKTTAVAPVDNRDYRRAISTRWRQRPSSAA